MSRLGQGQGRLLLGGKRYLAFGGHKKRRRQYRGKGETKPGLCAAITLYPFSYRFGGRMPRRPVSRSNVGGEAPDKANMELRPGDGCRRRVGGSSFLIYQEPRSAENRLVDEGSLCRLFQESRACSGWPPSRVWRSWGQRTQTGSSSMFVAFGKSPYWIKMWSLMPCVAVDNHRNPKLARAAAPHSIASLFCPTIALSV